MQNKIDVFEKVIPLYQIDWESNFTSSVDIELITAIEPYNFLYNIFLKKILELVLTKKN